MLQRYLSRFTHGSLRILDAGLGGCRTREITDHLLPFARGQIDFIERNVPRAEVAVKRMGGKINLNSAGIMTIMPSRQYNLIYVDVLQKQVERFLSHDLHYLRSLIVDNGIAIVTLPASVKFTAAAVPWRVKSHLQISHLPESGYEFQTLILSPFETQTPRAAFSLSNAIEFLCRMKSKVHFQSVDEYLKNKMESRHETGGKVNHFIKHDVHRDLAHTIRFAREEAKASLRGAYFFMPPHQLSRDYCDLPEFTDVLLEIQALGHDIGLHIDTIDAIRAEGGFWRYLGAFVGRLRGAGVRVRFANSHGNTEFKGHPWFNSQLVFSEKYAFYRDIALQRGDIPPEADSITLADVSDRLGLEAWFDSEVHLKGDLLQWDRYLLTDNSQRYVLISRVPRTVEVARTGRFESPPPEMQDILSQQTCLYLVHPQHYQ